MSKTSDDVAALDRILHRLVMTDDEKLEKPLMHLLPKLLEMLTTTPDTRTKVIEILSHVTKRLRPIKTINLPLKEIANIVRDSKSSGFTRNFSLAILEIGLTKIEDEDKGEKIRISKKSC